MRWLRLQFLRRHRRHRSHIRDWVESHPYLVSILERAGALHIDETTLARGIAVGLFIGMTPTVGIQTGMMLIAAFAFRANFFAAFLVSNVSNPLTMAPLYYGWNQLGHWLIDRLPIQPFRIDGIGEEIAFETASILLGSLVTAVPSAVLGYFGFLRLWRALDLRLPGQRVVDPIEQSQQRSSEPGERSD